MKEYAIFYKNQETKWPILRANTEAEALQAWAEAVATESGEDPAEILAEDWPSPQGVKKAAEAREANIEIPF